MRREAESTRIREAYPEAYPEVAVAVTELGATTVLMVVLATIYWLGYRREAALVISYAVTGAVCMIALKAALGMPRPPEELFLAGLDADTYGFPSGHAFAAVVVYGGLVSAFDRVRDWRALAVVGTLVVLISLSRVILGVHYLGDVIVGALLGVGFLFVMARLTDGAPLRGFAIALVVAIPAIFITGGKEVALLGTGGAIGGLLATTRLEAIPAIRSRLEAGIHLLVGYAFVVFLLAFESAAGATAGSFVLYYAVVFAGILLLPAGLSRVPIAPLGRDSVSK